jgi:hypothetical protein
MPDVDFSLVAKNYRGPGYDIDDRARVYVVSGSALNYDGSGALSSEGAGVYEMIIDADNDEWAMFFSQQYWSSSGDIGYTLPFGAAVCTNVFEEGLYLLGGRVNLTSPYRGWVARPWIRSTNLGLDDLANFKQNGLGGDSEFSARRQVERRSDGRFGASVASGPLAQHPAYSNMDNLTSLEQTDAMSPGVGYLVAIPVPTVIGQDGGYHEMRLRFIVDTADVDALMLNAALYYPYRYDPATNRQGYDPAINVTLPNQMVRVPLVGPGGPVDVSTVGQKSILLGFAPADGIETPGLVFAVFTVNAPNVRLRGLAGSRADQIHDLVSTGGTGDADWRFIQFEGSDEVSVPDPSVDMPDVLDLSDLGGWPLGPSTFFPLVVISAENR